MPRPIVLIATTDPHMAETLRRELKIPCREMGLKLEICPDADHCHPASDIYTYDSAENLLEVLGKRDPVRLADTLLILDLGVYLEEAFAPMRAKYGAHASNTSLGWHSMVTGRTGIAVELLLRFPQIFPVFLSAAVGENNKCCDQLNKALIHPTQPKCKDSFLFSRLKRYLGTEPGHGRQLLSLQPETLDALMAFRVPLHFVSSLDGFAGLKSTLTRFARGMRCWFDPTGLRTIVKNKVLGDLFGTDTDWSNTVTQRALMRQRLCNVAVAVDEEREFAALSAYAAYKFGRRAWMVTTYGEFNHCPLWTYDRGTEKAATDVVVLRDVDLRFPDAPTHHPNSRRNLRNVHSTEWSGKLGAQWHVCAVTGEFAVTSPFKRLTAPPWDLNAQRLGQSAQCREYLGFAKPVGKLHDLAMFVGDVRIGERLPLVAQLTPANELEELEKGHGASYVNLALAEDLLRQSRSCKDGPLAYLLGALLATEAYELLLGMSKTTALEALLEMHKKEVKAEVEFVGIAVELDTSPRRREVKETLDRLYTSSRFSDRECVKRMFLSQFWGELRGIYREGESFSAAEQANTESLVHGNWAASSIVKGLLLLAGATYAGVWSLKGENGDLLLAALLLLLISSVLTHSMVWQSTPAIKRFIIAPATSVRAWLTWFVILNFTLPVTYLINKVGWTSILEQISGGHHVDIAKAYVELLHDVALTTISLQLTNSLNDLIGNGTMGIRIITLFHVVNAYILLGLGISLVYRKITRS